jgi:hypothetical protein
VSGNRLMRIPFAHAETDYEPNTRRYGFLAVPAAGPSIRVCAPRVAAPEARYCIQPPALPNLLHTGGQTAGRAYSRTGERVNLLAPSAEAALTWKAV